MTAGERGDPDRSKRGPRARPEPALLRHQVRTVVRLVPQGRVVSYGDIAALLGIGPRQVGLIMATSDSDVAAGTPDPGRSDETPWWRVTDAAGRLPPHLRDEAIARWREEGTALARSGIAASIRTHRADLPALADAAERALGPLPGASGDEALYPAATSGDGSTRPAVARARNVTHMR